MFHEAQRALGLADDVARKGLRLRQRIADKMIRRDHAHPSFYKLPPADIVTLMLVGVRAGKVTLEAVVVVNADGSFAQCDVAMPSRFELLNAKACELATETSKPAPVRGADGSSVRGIRSYSILFSANQP
jgi:hypothetical protein